jgi:hypothetical protein
MRVGHHWVPEAVRKAFDELKLLSPDAIEIFKKSVTGDPHGVIHDGTSQDGVSHTQYNELVMKQLDGRISELREQGKLVKGKLTGPQAEAFVKGIKKNGLGVERIQKFNKGVLKTLRLAALAGIVAKGLEQTANAQNLAKNPSMKKHYKNALDALRKGDWHKADNEIRGGHLSDDNLLWDLRNAHFVREAGLLEGLWLRRVEEFRKIERGERVPGVPDDF